MNAPEEHLPIYMDCNATTPLDPQVRDIVFRYLEEDFGNAGSRTHEYGTRAKQAVQNARQQVAAIIDAEPHEVIFTSGATESNNLAILGLARHGDQVGKKHIISTQIEHKAVLEPLERLRERGFEITLLKPTAGGWVEAEAIAKSLRPDTLLVTVMHVNNETGIAQPIEEIAKALSGSDVFFHTDAAQGFGKELQPLKNKRLDLLSISGHKVFAPKGVGALAMRKRGFKRPPIEPLALGGGQERGIRPGTLPVALIVGLGLAAELAGKEVKERAARCSHMKKHVIDAFADLGATFNGDQSRALPHVINLSIPGIDSEASMLALRDLIAISNGSACTSQDYEPSHVLGAMGLDDNAIRGALRISWCPMTESPDWDEVVSRLRKLK